jgi:hypothetical protein
VKDAVDGVHKAGATLFAVSVRGTATTTAIREEVLNKVTQANGGMRLMPVGATGLEDSLKTIANTLNSQYSITFVRGGGGTPKTTKIETASGGKVLLTPWMR